MGGKPPKLVSRVSTEGGEPVLCFHWTISPHYGAVQFLLFLHISSLRTLCVIVICWYCPDRK